MIQEIKKDKNVLLYHHLGLGDHFMCHGIVREYCKRYKKVTIFSWPQNFTSVSFMFKDLDNLKIIKGDEKYAKQVIRENSESNNPEYDLVKIIGQENLDRKSGVQLERQFYKIAEIDFNKKWDSFFIERNSEKEQDFFNKFAPGKKYAFVHDDIIRNMTINTRKISKGLEIFYPKRDFTDNIFDYCTLVERAEEIHVIDSSFMFLIDLLDYKNPSQKLFVHRYARFNSRWKLPILRKKWHIYRLENLSSGLLKYIRWKFFEIKNKI